MQDAEGELLRMGILRSSRRRRSNTYEQSGLGSADLEALSRQEESGLFGDAQLG
jgi:hypothetical protein